MELDTSNTGEFAITSDQAIGMDLEITYSESGTATSGNDYSPLPGSITLPANQATVTMRLTALSDSEVEGNESVILTLQDTSAYSLGNSQSTVTIEDLPFDAYRAENFGSAIDNVAEHEDFDSDGIANLLEYAFRLDPTQQPLCQSNSHSSSRQATSSLDWFTTKTPTYRTSATRSRPQRI